MDDAVGTVLEDAFPDRVAEHVGSAGPSWNENNRTVRVEFAENEPVYLKIASDGDPSRLTREHGVISYVDANCEVTVPTICARNTSSDVSVPYLAIDPLPGESVADTWDQWAVRDRASMARRVGRTLAALHETRFESHGRITDGTSEGVVLQMESWPEMLLETIEYINDLAVSDRFDHHFEKVADAIDANRERLEAAPAVLVHGDVTRGNCFQYEGEIALLDWEDAHAGDPVRELRRTQQQLLEPGYSRADNEVVTALREGYRDRAGGLPDGFSERHPIYGALSFLDTSGFFDIWAPNADDPIEELATWVEEEMDRRLAEI